MASAAEIRNKALRRLGVLAIGQTATAEQGADLEAAYAEVYAALLERNLAVWGASEAVPDYLVNPVVALVAYARVNEYSVSDSRYQRLARDAGSAEGAIAAAIAGKFYTPFNEADF